MKAQEALKSKKEKDNVQLEEYNHEEDGQGQLWVRDVFLRMPAKRVPLPGDELPVRLR